MRDHPSTKGIPMFIDAILACLAIAIVGVMFNYFGERYTK